MLLITFSPVTFIISLSPAAFRAIFAAFASYIRAVDAMMAIDIFVIAALSLELRHCSCLCCHICCLHMICTGVDAAASAAYERIR